MLDKSARNGGCWMTRRYSKAVLFIIDALREDMVTLQDRDCDSPICTYAHNQMPKLQRLLRDNSSQTALFVFEADAPTVTSQRLKGLTTGGLPTFIDISSNFGSDVIHEDNLVDQLATLNKRYFMQFSIGRPTVTHVQHDLHGR